MGRKEKNPELTPVEFFIYTENLVIMHCVITNFYLEHVDMVLFLWFFFFFKVNPGNFETFITVLLRHWAFFFSSCLLSDL